MRERVEISERLRLCFGGVEGREALPSTSHWGTTNPLDLLDAAGGGLDWI
jgi:hypothetical protein